MDFKELHEKTKRRNFLGGIYLEDASYCDNLAVSLGVYFSSHADRPENDPENEHGWGEWVEEKTNEALDRISLAISQKLINEQFFK